jgi:phosphoenolpyruvate carboxylase
MGLCRLTLGGSLCAARWRLKLAHRHGEERSDAAIHASLHASLHTVMARSAARRPSMRHCMRLCTPSWRGAQRRGHPRVTSCVCVHRHGEERSEAVIHASLHASVHTVMARSAATRPSTRHCMRLCTPSWRGAQRRGHPCVTACVHAHRHGEERSDAAIHAAQAKNFSWTLP